MNTSSSFYSQHHVCYPSVANQHDLAVYEAQGGYKIWRAILSNQYTPEQIIRIIQASNLSGRGGAGFPTGKKWSFMSNEKTQKYVVCNSDEGEPGTFKDRDILAFNPHALIEGMAITAYTIHATVGYNYIRGEFTQPIQRFKQAVDQAYQAGLLGKNIQNSTICFDLHTHLGAGAYICGEETALLESLEGKKGQPRFKPPFPCAVGLYGKPTLINNTETLASVPHILREGADSFNTIAPGGTKIFSVSGHVNKPGNFEIPLGTPFSELLKMAGGVWKSNTLKAVIPGGSSTPVLTANQCHDLKMDYKSIQEAGSMLGSGAVIVMDQTTCMVRVLTRIAYFYYDESCGQCTPCREGTGWLYRVLQRILDRKGNVDDLKLLREIANGMMGTTICALSDAAAMPIQSFLEHFEDEFIAYIQQR